MIDIDLPIHMNGPALQDFMQALRAHPDYIAHPDRIMLDELVVGFDEYTLLDFNASNSSYMLTYKAKIYMNYFIMSGDITISIS